MGVKLYEQWIDPERKTHIYGSPRALFENSYEWHAGRSALFAKAAEIPRRVYGADAAGLAADKKLCRKLSYLYRTQANNLMNIYTIPERAEPPSVDMKEAAQIDPRQWILDRQDTVVGDRRENCTELHLMRLPSLANAMANLYQRELGELSRILHSVPVPVAQVVNNPGATADGSSDESDSEEPQVS